MISGLTIKSLSKNTDARGWLAEIFRSDEWIFPVAMAYASLTLPGVVRGPHEHKNQSDGFVFFGPGSFKLYLWDARLNSPTRGKKMELIVGVDNPCLVIIPPGVVHGYKCVSQEAALALNFPDKLYKGEGKKEAVDEIRHEDEDDSPYKIS